MNAFSYDADVLVVGSGASAVHAAAAALEAGLKVLIVDAGNEDREYRSIVPPKSFMEIRATDEGQHRFFLGRRFEGIELEKKEAAPQTTPPRGYVFERRWRHLPSEPLASGFAAVESFAQGGLAGAWGAVSFPFSKAELEACSLPADEMREHYEAVARKIGVTSCGEDLKEMSVSLKNCLPAAEMTANARAIFDRYKKDRANFLREGIRLGEPSLALLTRPLGARQANAYHDMDFWSNEGESVYRPAITLEELKKHPNFSYMKPYAVEAFEEVAGGGAIVRARELEAGSEKIFRAATVVLAAGTIGTARIALRSLGQYDVRIPIVSNSHSYLVGLVRSRLTAPAADNDARRHSLAQLTLACGAAQAQMYAYRSLLLFRLLPETRLAHREALRILRNLAPSMALWVVQHDEAASSEKYCVLRKIEGGDRLEIVYHHSPEETGSRRRALKKISAVLSKMGVRTVRISEKMAGSSIHYAGTFPASSEDKPLTTSVSGLLRGTKSIYIADGSVLPYLPAKGPTFTLMANARRIGMHAAARCAEAAR